jgi:exosome complex exonuclease DIS3/RRP44
MNRAIDGDVVVVEMLPEAEWKAPGQEVLDQDGEVRIWFQIFRN